MKRYFDAPLPRGFLDRAVDECGAKNVKPVRGKAGRWHIRMTREKMTILKLSFPEAFGWA